MRFERVRANIVTRNKINGKYYKVLEVDEERAILEENVIGENDEQKEQLIMTPKNAICFRLIEDPNKPETPTGYSVVDGTLFKDGAPATEQGSLTFKELLCCQPGYLVLSAVGKEDKENIDIFTYNPFQDKFRKIGNNLPDALSLLYIGKWNQEDETSGNDYAVFTYFVSHEEKQEKEGEEPVIAEKFDRSGIFAVHDGTITNFYPEEMVEVEYLKAFPADDRMTLVFKGGRKVKDGFMENEASEDNFILQVERGGKDESIFDPGFVLERKEVDEVVYCPFKRKRYIFADNAVSTDDPDEDTFTFPENIFQELLSRKTFYPVDVTEKHPEKKVTFASGDLSEVLCVTITQTKDRGTIIKMESMA